MSANQSGNDIQSTVARRQRPKTRSLPWFPWMVSAIVGIDGRKSRSSPALDPPFAAPMGLMNRQARRVILGVEEKETGTPPGFPGRTADIKPAAGQMAKPGINIYFFALSVALRGCTLQACNGSCLGRFRFQV